MKEKIQQFFKTRMNTKWLILILLVGVGLMLLPGDQTSKKETEASKNSSAAFPTGDYEKKLEKRLKTILESLEGISQVQVMITLEDSGQVYYAQDRASSEKGTGDAALSERSTQADEAVVLKNDSGGGQSPLVLKTKAPQVSGVLVTAKGVGSVTMQNDITSAVRAVLDVPAHRIKVLSK